MRCDGLRTTWVDYFPIPMIDLLPSARSLTVATGEGVLALDQSQVEASIDIAFDRRSPNFYGIDREGRRCLERLLGLRCQSAETLP